MTTKAIQPEDQALIEAALDAWVNQPHLLTSASLMMARQFVTERFGDDPGAVEAFNKKVDTELESAWAEEERRTEVAAALQERLFGGAA